MTLHLDGPCGSEICPFCRWYVMPADPCPWPRIDLFPGMDFYRRLMRRV